MTDLSPNPPAQAVPDPVVEPQRRWRPSIVWVVPLLAALIGLSLVAKALWERGPTITVTFSTAEGIEPGKTKVKFKDVDIGDVKTVRLSEDRSRVVVTIDLVKEARQIAVADSRFWVVRPRFAGSGISGLGTVLSGSYIGVDAGHARDQRKEFAGLDEPPVVPSDVPGRRFKLHADDIGSLDMGSPVFFRRIQVGHVESFVLDPDGHRITLGIFVKSPYDRFVTADSRFWHASGVDLRLDSAGVRLETQSLASVLLGGVAFEAPAGSTGSAAADGSEFQLASNHDQAIKAPDGVPLTVLLHFHQSVRGLAIGAPVDFRGVEIGHVRSIGLKFEPDAGNYSVPVVVDVFPDRLGGANAGSGDHAQQIARTAELVQHGLRAQLRPGNLLTGQLFVAVDFFPDAPPARLDTAAEPLELPTVPSDLEELHQQVQSVLRKLDKVPFDTLGQDADRLLVHLDQSLKRVDALSQRTGADLLPEIRESLQEMQRTMQTMQSTLAEDSPMQQDTRQALRGVAEATRSMKALTDSLGRNPESLLRGKKDTDR